MTGAEPSFETESDLTEADWKRIADEQRAVADLDNVTTFARPDDGELSFRLPFELFHEIKPRVDGRWLVKGLLRASAATVVFGLPGCGKSFLVLDWCLSISAEREWFGRRVSKGAVVYIAAEGQGGVRARVEAWRREHGFEDEALPFAILPRSVDLFDPAAGDLAALHADLETLRTLWGCLDLIAVDTLNATIGAGDENGPDMGAYVGNVRRICAPFDCAWLVVTHVPVTTGDVKRPRGHGSLWGTVDTGIQVSGDRDAPARRIHVTKQKDDDPGSDILFKLRPVTIGTDDQGDDVTSCIVEQSELEPSEVRGRRKLSAKEQIVFAALERAIVANGRFPPNDIPDNVLNRARIGKAVAMSEWRSEAIAALAEPDTKPDTARKAFDRARQQLQAAEIAGVWEDWAWLA